MLECAKGSIESIVEANGLQGSPILRVELQQSAIGGGSVGSGATSDLEKFHALRTKMAVLLIISIGSHLDHLDQ